MSGAMAPEAETIIRQQDTINRLMGQSATRIEQVQRSLDAAYAAQTRFQAAQNTINVAMERGRISQERANQLLDLARQKYQQTGQAAQAFAVANDNVARRSSNLGQVIGQAGFQIQDFAVQVASGQSALTAFAQQAPQFLGVLGTGGIIAGAAVAIGAIVVRLFDATAAQRAFTDALKAAGDVYERNTDIARRWREGLEDEQNRVRDLTAAYENMNTAQREYERRRLMDVQAGLRTQQQGLERNTERELAELRRVIDRQIAAAREATFRARQLDRNAPTVEVSPDLRAGVAALSALGEPGQRTASNVEEVARRLAEAGASGGQFAEILRDTGQALDRLIPGWRQLSEAVQRNQRDLQANEEAARRAGEGLGAMGAQASGAEANVNGLTGALARLQAQTNAIVGAENAAAIRRAEERAQAIGRGLGAVREFDARQAQTEASERFFREQRRQDEERLRAERYTNDQIRAELTRTDDARRQSANQRAALEAENNRRVQALEDADRRSRRGGASAARDARRESRETDRLLSSLDQEYAINLRLRDSLEQLAEARRRNLITEEQQAEFAARARERAQQQIQEANARRIQEMDKSELYAEDMKRLQGLTNDFAAVMRDTWDAAVREGKSFNDVLKSLEQQLLRLGDKYLLQPLLDQMAQLAMMQLGGGGGGGGGGGILGMVGSMFGLGGPTMEVAGMGMAKGIEAAAMSMPMIFHEGGVVGEPGAPTRPVPAAVFLDAPRYHSGGFAGGMPFANDEVPAILRRGEVVLTERQQAAAAQRMNGVTVVNNIVTPSAGDFRASGAQISAEMARHTQRAVARNR